jgi:hypothetical protein
MGRTSWRHVDTIPYQANSPQRRELDISGYVRRLWLHLSGTLNVTVGGGTAITRNPGTLVPNLTLYRNSEEILKQGRWNDWRDRQYMYYGKIATEVQAAAGVAAYAISSWICLPFETPMARQPQDTVLSLGAQEKLELEVQWGDENSLLAAGTKAWTVNPTIRVLADISRWDLNPVAVFKETSFETPSLGAVLNTDLNIELVTGPLRNIQNILLVCEDNVAVSLRNLEDRINFLRLTSTGGGREENVMGQLSGFEQQAYVDTLFGTVPGIQTGMYPIPFQGLNSGMASYNLSTAGLSDLRFHIDHAAFTTQGFIRVLEGIWEPLQKRG